MPVIVAIATVFHARRWRWCAALSALNRLWRRGAALAKLRGWCRCRRRALATEVTAILAVCAARLSAVAATLSAILSLCHACFG